MFFSPIVWQNADMPSHDLICWICWAINTFICSVQKDYFVSLLDISQTLHLYENVLIFLSLNQSFQMACRCGRHEDIEWTQKHATVFILYYFISTYKDHLILLRLNPCSLLVWFARCLLLVKYWKSSLHLFKIFSPYHFTLDHHHILS